jgi:hypothetical protein
MTQAARANPPGRTSKLKSFSRLLAICFGLTASFWIAAKVSTQEHPASSQALDMRRPPFLRPTDPHWNAFEWAERRYKIEALRFKARHETGVSWPGADEVMVATTDAKGGTVSDKIDDIDTGETHQFVAAKSCIVAVRPGIVVLGKTSVCDDVGEPAPLWFEVEFWEKDPIGYPTGFCISGVPSPGNHVGPHCPNDGDGDDFIGGSRLDFAAWELEAALPNVGDQYDETIALSPCFGTDVCGYGPGPWYPGDYTFTYRITRLPDVQVGLRALLDKAMPRIGARSELDAIAAGLRSLNGPSPRRVEP